MLDKVFDDLHPYLKVVKRSDNFYVIEVHFKKSWIIPEHDTIKSKSQDLKDDKKYYMFFSEQDTFDKILEWLVKDVIDFNIVTEQKEALLREKVAELKEMFESSSLDELKNLKFNSQSDDLKLTGKTTKPDESKQTVTNE